MPAGVGWVSRLCSQTPRRWACTASLRLTDHPSLLSLPSTWTLADRQVGATAQGHLHLRQGPLAGQHPRRPASSLSPFLMETI